MPNSRPRQVAAICYQRNAAAIEFLLVRTNGDLWTFPKGQIDPGHTEAEAALQEAEEEAGASGILEQTPFSTFIYTKSDRDQDPFETEIAAYLLEVQKTHPPQETYRRPQWFGPEAAKAALAIGRKSEYAQELARIVDTALARLTPLK